MVDLTNMQKMALGLLVLAAIGGGVYLYFSSRKQNFQCGCGMAMSTAPPMIENIVVAPPSAMMPQEEQYQSQCGAM